MEREEINEIQESIYVLIRRMGFLQKEGAQCCGVSFVQSHVIHEIGKCPGVSVNDLTAKLGLYKSTTSRHIKELIKQGYVTSISSEDDRRYLMLSLTESGDKLDKDLRLQMNNYLQLLFKQIPNEKQSQVIDSIQTLVTVLSKVPICCSPLTNQNN